MYPHYMYKLPTMYPQITQPVQVMTQPTIIATTSTTKINRFALLCDTIRYKGI